MKDVGEIIKAHKKNEDNAFTLKSIKDSIRKFFEKKKESNKQIGMSDDYQIR